MCQAGFFAIGSYATAILATKCGWSFWATLPVSIALSALFGFLIGLPTLRLKGDYLAIATLGFGEIVRNVLNNWDSLTNGPMGIQDVPMATIFGKKINPYSKVGFLFLCIVFVVIAYFLFQRLARSRMGRALEAIREDEIAAASTGINVTKYKVVSFMQPQVTLDLHGYKADEAAQAARKFLQDSFQHHLLKICLIPGKGIHSEDGNGVLKEVVLSEVRLSGVVREAYSPKACFGGSGVIWVILKDS